MSPVKDKPVLKPQSCTKDEFVHKQSDPSPLAIIQINVNKKIKQIKYGILVVAIYN